MVISPEEFMRALAFARAINRARPREEFYGHLIGRLGEMIFRHEARRVLPVKSVGELNWIAMPKHVDTTGVDLRIGGWKIDVKTSHASMALQWPACKRSDLFPLVRFDPECQRELSARYKNPKQSTPIGLLDDPIMTMHGAVVGWIGIGSAEQLAGDSVVASRVEDELASAESLWALLKSSAGPDIKLADAAWQKAREAVPPRKTRARRLAPEPVFALLPARRASRRPSVAA